MEKRQFKDDWKTKYLMWPIHNDDSNMICIQCQEHLRTKSSTASRHIERKPPSSLSYTTEKRMRLIRQFKSMYAKQRSTLTAAIEHDALVKLAPYKLAFVIGKHKMPFSSCNAFLNVLIHIYKNGRKQGHSNTTISKNSSSSTET